MNKDLKDFKEFMSRRESAAVSYVSGDPQPLDNISATDDLVTFFSPGGDFEQGAKEVSERYKKDSGLFDEGSQNYFEILQMDASGDIAYWVGFQRAQVNLKGKPVPVPFNLRITEIFRRENGDWKLVHRHADELKVENKKG